MPAGREEQRDDQQGMTCTGNQLRCSGEERQHSDRQTQGEGLSFLSILQDDHLSHRVEIEV